MEIPRVIITSTANGIGNVYHKIWEGASQSTNEYKPFRVDWWDVPGRDEKWKEETIKNTSEAQFQTEFECEFLGSVDTLINASKIKTMPVVEPKRSGGLDVYEMPKKKHIYTITVDVSRGLTNDYSAFCVMDCTSVPYKVVAKYRDNEIKPLVFPSIIEKVAKVYNKAYILIEINDLGQQVADNLQFEKAAMLRDEITALRKNS